MKLWIFIWTGLIGCLLIYSSEAKNVEISISHNENFKYLHMMEQDKIARKFSRHLIPYVKGSLATIGIDNGAIVKRDLHGGFKLISQRSINRIRPRREMNRIYAKRGTSSSVSLGTLVPDAEWFGNISIGTPPQQVLMNFDTGSSDFWVVTPLTLNETASNHSTFVPTASSSFKNSSKTWDILYGDGSKAHGYIGYDNVLVGSLNIMQHPIEIASTVGKFDHDVISGILGLSFQNNVTNSKPVKSLFDDMVKQGVVETPEFGVQLIKGSSENGGKGGGKYVFGGYDISVISGNITTRPVENFGDFGKIYWASSIENIEINKHSVLSGGIPVLSVFDTGSTLAFVDDSTANNIHRQISNATYDRDNRLWRVPCDLSGPTIYFTIGGQKFGIPMKDLAAIGSSDINKDHLCISGIQGGMAAVPATDNAPSQPLYFLIGSIFIKNNYLIFNQGGSDEKSNSTIGFAARKDVVLP